MRLNFCGTKSWISITNNRISHNNTFTHPPKTPSFKIIKSTLSRFGAPSRHHMLSKMPWLRLDINKKQSCFTHCYSRRETRAAAASKETTCICRYVRGGCGVDTSCDTNLGVLQHDKSFGIPKKSIWLGRWYFETSVDKTCEFTFWGEFWAKSPSVIPEVVKNGRSRLWCSRFALERGCPLINCFLSHTH